MIRTIIAGAAVLAISACGSPTPVEPGGHDVGEIVRLGPGLWGGGPDGPLQMHVDFGAHDECGIIFTVGAATPITDARSEPPVRGSEKILVMGATVAVGYRLVNQSCPGQSWPDAVARLR